MDKDQKAERLKLLKQVHAKMKAKKHKTKENERLEELLRDDRQRHDEMKAEDSGDSDPALEVLETSDEGRVPGCSWRRPTPSSERYENMNGDKRLVEGRRSVDLHAPVSSTPEDAIVAIEKAEIVNLVVQSAKDEASEDSDSDEHPAVLMAGSTMRNPTGHERSTRLDPDAHRSPEEMLSEKEEKFRKGEDLE